MATKIMHTADEVYGKGYIEDSPSRIPPEVLDPDWKKKKNSKSSKKEPDEAMTELIESSPFYFDEEKGFIVPGEDLSVLSGKLTEDQMKEVEEKALVVTEGSTKSPLTKGNVVIISTDTVDDRFDNI